MKLLSWNCRGAGSPDTIRYVIRLSCDHKPNILFLMETRVPSVQARRILRRSHFTQLAAVEVRGFAGGLWCFWDDQAIRIRVLSFTAQLLNIALITNDSISNLISLVYASPSASIREQLYKYVENMAYYVNIPWILVGDFNMVLSQEDKRGGRPVGAAVDRMQRMIDEYDLIEHAFSGHRFTWSNGQLGRFLIEQRLDQAWANRTWHLKFQSSTLQHLTLLYSDHSPLLPTTQVSPQDTNPGRIFKFQANWMDHPDFAAFMASAWKPITGDFCRTVAEFKI